MSITLDAVLLSCSSEGQEIKRSVSLTIDRVGKTTREGVRVEASLSGNTLSVLVTRESPASLRPGINYCPLSIQKSEGTRAVFESLLLPKPVAVSFDSAESEKSEESADDTRELQRKVGQLRRIPLAISKPIDTYPKLVALVKRLQKLETEFGFSWRNLSSLPGRVQELMGNLSSVEAWERVAREVESPQALSALETAIRQELPVKFLKSFPGFMNIRKKRKSLQRVPVRSSEAAEAWARQWISFLSEESLSPPAGFPIRGGRPVKSHWLSGQISAVGNLTLHASSQLRDCSGLAESRLLLTSSDLPLPPGPLSFYVLFFLSRIPAGFMINHPVYPLLRFLLPFLDGEFTAEQRRAILGNGESLEFSGLEMDVGFIAKKELRQFVANLVLKLAESQSSVAHQLSPVQSAALLRYLQSAGASKLRRAVSVQSLPARAVVAKTEAAVLALVIEAANDSIVSPAVRQLHLRLAAIQRWKAQVRLNSESLNFPAWRQTQDSDLLVAGLKRWETCVLRCLYTCPAELFHSEERGVAIKQLQSIRWLKVSLEMLASRLPSLAECKYHLSRLPTESLRSTSAFSSLAANVGKCEKLLTSMFRRFEGRDELEDFAIMTELGGFDISKSDQVTRAISILAKLNSFSRTVNSGELTPSLSVDFADLEKVMVIPEPERSLWLSFAWQQKTREILSADSKDHAEVKSLLEEQETKKLSPGDINLAEIRRWESQVSGIIQLIRSSGDFSLLADLSSLNATSTEIKELAEFSTSLQSLSDLMQSMHISRIDDLRRVRTEVDILQRKWPGRSIPDQLGILSLEINSKCSIAESLDAEALSACANAKTVDIKKATSILSKCQLSHSSEAVEKLSTQVQVDTALANQAESVQVNSSYRLLTEAVQGLTEQSGFKQDPVLIARLRDSLWVATVALMARWAASPRLVAPGPPWLLLLELKSITPAAPPAECLSWLTKALQTSERILKEVKPLATDVLTGTGIPERLGKWLRLRLLLPLYPIGLGEPMEQMRGLLEQKFPGYRLSCGYLPSGGATHQRRLESTSVTLPGGRPGAKVSTRPGRSMLELVEFDKLSSGFKQKVAGTASPVTAESLAAKALKQAGKIPRLLEEISELTGRTVTTAADVFSEADFGLGFESSSEEWFRLASVSGFDASLTCGVDDATKIEEMMLLEIPAVSRSEHSAYLDRFIRTLLHIQTTGNADRILARQRQAPLTSHVETSPVPVPVVPEQAPPPSKVLWAGTMEGTVKGSTFGFTAALLPLFSPETVPPVLDSSSSWRFDGSMSQVKFTDFFAKLEASGKRSLFNFIVCVHDWTVAPTLFASLLGSDPYVSAFVLGGAKLPKLWLVPPEPGASFICGILETMASAGTPVRNMFGDALGGWVTELEFAANAGSIPGVSSVFTDIPQPEEPESPVSLESEAGEEPADTQAMVDIMMQLHRQLASQSAPPVQAAPVRNTSEFELSAASLREALRSRSGPAQPPAQQPATSQGSLTTAHHQALLQQLQQPSQPSQNYHQPSSSGLPGVLSFFSTPGMNASAANYGTDASNAPVCKFFNMGTCNKGTSCRFSHVCNICRGPHNAFEHDRVFAPQAAPPQAPRMSWRNL